MGGYYNPVRSGMLTAFNIAQRFRRAKLEEAEYQHRVMEDERQRKRQEFADQLDQFKLQMGLQEMGATPTTPQDVAEAEIPRYRMDEAGEQTRIGTGTDIRRRIIRAPGVGAVTLPSLQERME